MSKLKFAIIANPRTGSNNFIEFLNSHPDITCHREVFHRDAVYLENEDCQVSERDKDPLGYLEQLYDNCSTLACGLKIFDNQNDFILQKILSFQFVKKIILYRANFLAVYSSEKLAEMTRCYVMHSIENDKSSNILLNNNSANALVEFDELDFEQKYSIYTNHYKRTIHTLNDTCQKYLFVTYEDYLNPSLFRRVYSFLDLSQINLIKSGLMKQNTNDIISRFSNSDDVMAYLEKKGRLNWAYEGFIQWD